MIITIDGPAGSGKSTIANIIAEKLGFVHFNSGSLYRGLGAYILLNKLELNDIENTPLTLETKFIKNIQNVIVNNQNMTDFLRDNKVSILTPQISVIPKIRNLVDFCQKSFCNQNNVVIDGRDLGSYVFPDAQIKFYLDCSIEERARRRFKEEQQKNPSITLETIKQQIIDRDNADRNKTIAPLCIPESAIIIDSSNLTIDEVVEKMLKFIKQY